MVSFNLRKAYLGSNSSISTDNEKIGSKYKFEEYFINESSSEETEVEMQKIIIDDLSKNEDINLILGSDLTNQISISSETLSSYDYSYFGVYSACASFVEELILASTLLNSKIKSILTIVSSHNLSAERTFRYPIEYGSPSRHTQTFTLTAAVGVMVQKQETKVRLVNCTIGNVINYGIKDVSNMGAIMAPSAALTLMEHLKNYKLKANYYDVIVTGDLGILGTKLFKEILKKNDITIKNHMDAGSNIINDKSLSSNGGSGPACLPLFLTENILKNKKYKKILLIGTGALFNTRMVNQHKELLSISHAISLEVTL